MRRTILVAGAAAALALPAAAPARPIELGAGTAPDVVADPGGNAHIVWAGGERTTVEYCRLPRRGGCDVRAALPVVEGTEGRPRILRRARDRALIVVDGRDLGGTDRRTYAWTSTDGGATWSAPVQIGIQEGIADARLTPDGTAVDLVNSDPSVMWFQRAPLAGPPEARRFDLSINVPTRYGGGGAIYERRDGRPIVLQPHSPPAIGLAVRAFKGGDLYDFGAWASPAYAGQVGLPAVASGRRGTYVLSPDRGLNGGPFIQRLRGERLSRSRRITRSPEERTYDGHDLAQDPRGRLHAAWNPCLLSFGCVAYARTRGRRWEGRRVLYSLTGTAVEYVAVDAFPDGGAVVATGTEMAAGPVRVVRVPRPRSR